jgi:hypothetical protein
MEGGYMDILYATFKGISNLLLGGFGGNVQKVLQKEMR